jgi:carboxypeptidase family protein
MRKLFLVLFIVAAAFSTALAQQSQSAPNMGRAPARPDGIGRADVRVFDAQGNPIKGARVHLKSTRSGGFLCESWAPTSAQGVAVLPPLHMGNLEFTVKAPGYQTQTLNVAARSLSEPVRVTLMRKT